MKDQSSSPRAKKDVDALMGIGVSATCNPGGAEKWQDEYSAFLEGADVIVIPDKDEAGEKHLAEVSRSLAGVAARVRVLRLPVKDAHDWIAAGGTAEQLWRLLEDAEAPKESNLIISGREFITGFIPPDYLIDRMLRRRFANALTSRTGDGKTAVMMRIGAHVVLSQQLGRHHVEKGRVLISPARTRMTLECAG